MPIYVHTVLAFISCLGFGVLFNVQKRTLLLAALNGAIGWTILLSLDIPQVSYISAVSYCGRPPGGTLCC